MECKADCKCPFYRVDMRIPNYGRTWSEISRSSSLCFKINHIDQMEESSRSLVRELIPGMPESSHIMPPMQIDMGTNVKIGSHVFINHSLTIIARGGILVCVAGRGYYQEEGKDAVEMKPGEETSNEWCEPVTNEVYGQLK